MTTTTPGDRLRDRRLAAGLTIDEAWADLRATLPRRDVPSPSKLQRMETEVPEEKWNAMVIYGLARIYRCRIGDLSPLVAAEFEEVSDLVASSLPWIPMCPGQLVLLSVA